MTPPDTDYDRLARLAAGELTPSESAELRAWLEQNPSEARAHDALRQALQQAPPARPVDVEAALRVVKTRLRPATPWARYVALAAAAVVLLIAGTYTLRFSGSSLEPTPVTYSTGVGERDSVTLVDGSRIVLGPASRVTVVARDVELTGEAFFVVTHDEQRPFTVRAGNAVIRDLGTQFTVHNDGEDGDVRVVVSEGAVHLAHAADSVVLQPGDVGTLASGRVRADRGAATDDDLAWTRGRLVFRDASIGEVAADLRRWYGVELRVTDTSLLRRHFTGSFTTEPVSRVVGDIAIALGARADLRGDTVTIVRSTRR